MTSTLAATVAAHRAGKSPAQTIAETYAAHRRAMPIPRCSSRCGRRARLWPRRERLRRRVTKASRCSASRSRSRTISTSPACRRPPPAPPSPIRRRVRRSSSSGSSAAGAIVRRQDQSRPVRDRPRRRALALWRPAQRASGRSDPRRLQLGLGVRGRRRPRAVRARHRHRGLRARAGRAQRNRRAEAQRSARLSTSGVVPACRTLDTISIFALDVADAFAAFEVAAGYDAADPYSRRFAQPALADPGRLRIGAPEALEFFGDAEAEAAFARDVDSRRRARREIVRVRLLALRRGRAAALRGPLGRRALCRHQAADRDRPRRAASGDAHDHRGRAQIRRGRGLRGVLQARGAAAGSGGGVARLRRDGWCRRCRAPTPSPKSQADPSAPTRRLGTYTNFVNLLDLAAFAVPAGLRGDGLPSQRHADRAQRARTVCSPALAAQIHAALRRADGRDRPAGAAGARAARDSAGRIELALVGAHLAGLPLNRELSALGRRASCAKSRRRATTGSTRCRARSRPSPACCALRTGEGAAIKAEIWSSRRGRLRRLRAEDPSPLGVGTLRLRRRRAAPRAFWSRPKPCGRAGHFALRRLARLSRQPMTRRRSGLRRRAACALRVSTMSLRSPASTTAPRSITT